MSKKVLVSAYSCEPGYTSEREVGWRWSNLLAKHFEVYVLTRESNRKSIERVVAVNGSSSLNFIYFDLPKWLTFWKKGERGLYLYYLMWQLGSVLFILRKYKHLQFDYAQYLTFGSILLPTFLFLHPAKLIWGPIGGGENVPFEFWKTLSIRGRFKEIVRHLFQNLYRVNPIIRLMSKKAEIILLRNKETSRLVPKKYIGKTKLLMETGLPDKLVDVQNVKVLNEFAGDYLRIITVGRYIYSKINRLTLDSIAQFKEYYGDKFRFIIVGDGIERTSLEGYCKKLGLCREVVFTGWLSQEDVFKELSISDIYFSTTFKEGGTWAFFEAVTMEIPIVCLAASGPDLIVGDDCGIKVKLTTPEEVTKELAHGLFRLGTSPLLREEYSKKAKAFLLENYTWENIENTIISIYKNIT